MSHVHTTSDPTVTPATATPTTSAVDMTTARTTALTAGDTTMAAGRSTRGTYPECPLCGSDLFAEHAHFKCAGCGWRDSCCD